MEGSAYTTTQFSGRPWASMITSRWGFCHLRGLLVRGEPGPKHVLHLLWILPCGATPEDHVLLARDGVIGAQETGEVLDGLYVTVLLTCHDGPGVPFFIPVAQFLPVLRIAPNWRSARSMTLRHLLYTLISANP